MKVHLKKAFFRVLGVVIILSVFPSVILLGTEGLLLFDQSLRGNFDPFGTFLVIVSYFMGIIVLFWVGFSVTRLQAFGTPWLYFLAFPIATILFGVYDIGLIFRMDAAMSTVVAYIFLYGLVLIVLYGIHAKFYTPISKEPFRHIRLEEPTTTSYIKGFVVFLVGALGLIFIHPEPFDVSLQMLFSPVTMLLDFVQSYR